MIQYIKKLIHKFSTRDLKYKLFNMGELETLIHSKRNTENWYCRGRVREEDYVSMCMIAYENAPVDRCPADCQFYKISSVRKSVCL